MKQHQVILHIGQTKTGTTSIQDFLHTNQVNLEASDIYYTQRPERYTSHRYLFHLINSSIPSVPDFDRSTMTFRVSILSIRSISFSEAMYKTA